MQEQNDCFVCPICIEYFRSGSSFVLTDCQHKFCIPCFNKWESKHIIEGNIEDLKCPMCRALLKEKKTNEELAEEYILFHILDTLF